MADALQKVSEGREWDNVMLEDAKIILSDESFLSDMLIATADKQDTLLHMVAITEVPEVVEMVIEAYAKKNKFRDCMLLKNIYHRTPMQAAVVHGHTESAILLFEECLKSCPDIISKGEDDGNTLLHNACGLVDNLNVLKYLIKQDICQPMLLTPWSTRGTELIPLDIAQELVQDARSTLRTFQRARKPNQRDIQRQQSKVDAAQDILSTIEGPTLAAKRAARK